jgi:hypothetical protein
MFTRQWCLAFTLCLGVGSWAHGQSRDSDPRTDVQGSPGGAKFADNDRLEALVRKLGSSSFVQREKARKELEAIGTSALEPLRRAKKTADAETNRRIAELIRLFEEQVLIRQILEPKQVHLKLNGVSVQQAIAELANLSGYPIQFQGDATRFADKKITLDTGKISFWQALDKLCEQSGLIEQVNLNEPPISLDTFVLPNGKKGGLRRIQQFPMPAHAPAGPIVLVNRGNERSLVSYAGAVKIEVRISRDAGTKELNLLFVVAAEPRLLSSTLVGRPLIEKAFNEENRSVHIVPDAPSVVAKVEGDGWGELDLMLMGMERANRRHTLVRVKDDGQTAKRLKELAGKLTLQLDLQNETLARIDNVLQSAGKSANGANGGTMTIQSIQKLGGGVLELQVSLADLNPNPFGGNVIINGGNVIIRGNVKVQGMIIGPGGVRINGGNAASNDLPDIVDAKGQKYKLGNVSGDSLNFVNGSSSRTATIQYLPNPGQAEPRELVLFGARSHIIAVPFRFENIPLP